MTSYVNDISTTPSKTWARLNVNQTNPFRPTNAVLELLTTAAHLVPGVDIPPVWTDDVTSVSGIAVGWLKQTNGTFTAPS